jgi:ribosomal protein L12E/L44/L45/RPP1/RPP2
MLLLETGKEITAESLRDLVTEIGIGVDGEAWIFTTSSRIPLLSSA